MVALSPEGDVNILSSISTSMLNNNYLLLQLHVHSNRVFFSFALFNVIFGLTYTCTVIIIYDTATTQSVTIFYKKKLVYTKAKRFLSLFWILNWRIWVEHCLDQSGRLWVALMEDNTLNRKIKDAMEINTRWSLLNRDEQLAKLTNIHNIMYSACMMIAIPSHPSHPSTSIVIPVIP